VAGEGGWLTAHQLTKSQAMLPSSTTHPLGAWWQHGGDVIGHPRHQQAAAARHHGGDKDTGGNINGKGTDSNQQSTKIGGGNGNGNGNNDSNDKK
jgi:hypothetical protein